MQPILATCTAVCVFALSFTLGCSASAPDEGEESFVSQTVVTIDKDGRQTVSERVLTQRQARAELDAARGVAPPASSDVGTTSQALTQDPGCAGSSLWLFDAPNRTGNELCFRSDSPGYQIASLSAYTRCTAFFRGTCISTAPWTQAIRAYWGGADRFFFTGTGPECLSCRNPYVLVNDTVSGDSCAARDTSVGFNFGTECTGH
jgi:hypothetical protein